MNDKTIPSDVPLEYMRGYSDGVKWARQQEREECAKVCEDVAAVHQENRQSDRAHGSDTCAVAIRERGQS